MILAITILAALYTTLLLHELSHVLMLKFYGVPIKSFKPYPHWANGRLYFGRVTYYTIDSTVVARKRSAAAPLVMSMFVGCAWIKLADTTWPGFWYFAGAEALNIAWWVFGFAINMRGSDGAKWRE